MSRLFTDQDGAERLLDDQGELIFYPSAFTDDDVLLERLTHDIPWSRHQLRLYGKQLLAPRLSAWFGDPGCHYAYSGIVLEAQPMPPLLLSMRERLVTLTGHDFNSVLLNLYRDGRDSMSWHADDEPELGPAPIIASVSLGATRRFRLRKKADHQQTVGIELTSGSLLMMQPPLQQYWQHAVPKTKVVREARINLTWRQIL